VRQATSEMVEATGPSLMGAVTEVSHARRRSPAAPVCQQKRQTDLAQDRGRGGDASPQSPSYIASHRSWTLTERAFRHLAGVYRHRWSKQSVGRKRVLSGAGRDAHRLSKRHSCKHPAPVTSPRRRACLQR
jgi:hypothetical protein